MGTGQKKPSFFEGLEWYEIAVSVLPLGLLAVGGAIGGALGGAAFAANIQTFKSEIPTPFKYIMTLASPVAAFLIYVAIVAALAAAFPGLFSK